MKKKIKTIKKPKTSQVAVLTFDLSDFDARQDFELMIKFKSMHLALSDIADKLFRPHRKHGYSQEFDLNKYLNSDVEAVNEASYETISELEDKFYEILKEYDIDLS